MGSQQGGGSMCGCSLSILVSLYSHILSSVDSSNLLLLHCIRDSLSNLGISEAACNLNRSDLKHGGFSTSNFFLCCTDSLPLIHFTTSLHSEVHCRGIEVPVS